MAGSDSSHFRIAFGSFGYLRSSDPRRRKSGCVPVATYKRGNVARRVCRDSRGYGAGSVVYSGAASGRFVAGGDIAILSPGNPVAGSLYRPARRSP